MKFSDYLKKNFKKGTKKSDYSEFDEMLMRIDENENLFTTNINIINSELMHKSRLKTLRNNLNHNSNGTFKRQNINKFNYEMKSLKNLAILDLVDVVCSRYNFVDEKLQKKNYSKTITTKQIQFEQIENMANILVQTILLDQHYIDYQWPSSTVPDVDENFDIELESIKLFIERFDKLIKVIY